MNVEYKIINNGNFKIGEKSFPDWRVQQIINGEIESEWDGSWTQTYAEKTKRYLERSNGLEFFDIV